MKKIITLALVLAGVCSLNAAPREFKVPSGQEIATIQLNSAASSRATAPNRAATLRGDTIPANEYTWNYYQSITNAEGIDTWIQGANISMIVPGTQNVKEERYYAFYTGINGFEDEKPIIGHLSEDGYYLTFPVGQTFMEMEHPTFGHLDIQLYNANSFGTSIAPDENNPVILKREQNKWVAYTEERADTMVYSGYFYVGAKVTYQGKQGFVGFGYFGDNSIQQLNTYAQQYNYDPDAGTISEQLPTGVYGLMYGMWLDRNGDKLKARNIFGYGQDELVEFNIDRTNKTIETEEYPIAYSFYHDNFGLLEWFPVCVDSVGNESATLKATYEVLQTEQGTVYTQINFDFDQCYLIATVGNQDLTYSAFISLKWIYFGDLDDLSAGVENAVITEANNAPVEYFNLQGIRINRENAANGVYIRRQGNEVSKIVL